MRLAIAIACVAWCGPARADGVITKRGRDVIATPHRDETCEGSCATTNLARALTGLAFGRVTATLGGESNGKNVSGGATVDVVTVDDPIGSFYVGRVEAMYLPQAARIRLTVADVDALFGCRDPVDVLRAPIVGQTTYVCTPGSRLGIGGVVGELAWDPATGRVAARWAELQAVVNLLGATSSMAYVRGHLDASIGIDAESVWHGDRDARRGSDHVSRGVVALKTLLRSPNASWEARVKLELRPVLVGTVASFADYGVVAEATALYHVLVGSSTVVSTGIDARADRWSDPATSIGPLDAPTGKTSVFVGAIVEVRHESAR